MSTKTDRQTNTQTDRQTSTETDRQTDTWQDRHTHMYLKSIKHRDMDTSCQRQKSIL